MAILFYLPQPVVEQLPHYSSKPVSGRFAQQLVPSSIERDTTRVATEMAACLPWHDQIVVLWTADMAVAWTITSDLVGQHQCCGFVVAGCLVKIEPAVN